jgi:PKD repeat protein
LSFTSSLPVSSVNWDLGNSTASTQTNPTLTYASTGNYDVILEATASNGCVGIASKTVSIYNPPVANFSVPNPATTCTNQLYEFANISAFDAGSSPTWQWSVDGDPVSTTEDLAQAFTSIDSYSVKLVASIPGCSSEITKPFSISEQGLPVDFTISGNCQLTDVTFDDVTPGAATEVEWDFGDGASSNNGLSTHSYLNAGVYDVVLNVTSASGCVNSTTKQLTVYSLPVPAFSLDLPPFSCSGTPSQFHDATAALPDSNVQSWSWTFGDSGNGTGKNPTHTYTNAGQFNVGLQVTTDRGCSASKTQQVTIAQSPVASFNMDPACVNQATRLTDNSTGAVTAWQWKIGSAVYTSQNPQHTFPIPGNYSVQLTVTGQNNCTNTTSRQAVVPVVPTVDFNVTNPCADQPAVFTDATASAADPVEVRNWTFGTNGNATGQSAEFAFATPGAYSTQLQVTTGSGCRYSATKQVTINPSPVASFTMSNESGPSPLSVLFANTSTGAVSHQWNFDDGTSSTETSVAHTFTQLGDHTVDLTVTNTSGCSKTESKIVTVVDPMNELALIELSWVQINSGPSWQIFIRVKNNGNYRIESFFVTYDIGGTMSFGEVVTGSLDPGEERGFFLGNTFGNPGEDAYICVALPTDENPDDNKVCSSFTGNSHIFNASPNPASDYLNIESVTAGDELLVKIYSISGALAYDRSFSVHGYTRLSLDIQNLSPGIYVIVVSTAGQASSRKILIAR